MFTSDLLMAGVLGLLWLAVALALFGPLVK